jgi:hypothetical protein
MLIPHPIPGKAKSYELINAFIAGAPREAEGHVFYGVKDENAEAWHAVLRKREPFWFLDNAYFDRARGTHYRITKNGLQHTGQGQSDGQRFKALGVSVREERYPSPPGWVVVVPQSAVFMRHTVNARGWVEAALERFGPDTIFRVRPWSSNKPEAATTLQSDLARASHLVTHSSAAAVEAVLAGVQVVVSPLSCAHSLGTALPSGPERKAWAEVLADNQFLKEEMRSGLAWRMLNP